LTHSERFPSPTLQLNSFHLAYGMRARATKVFPVAGRGMDRTVPVALPVDQSRGTVMALNVALGTLARNGSEGYIYGQNGDSIHPQQLAGVSGVDGNRVKGKVLVAVNSVAVATANGAEDLADIGFSIDCEDHPSTLGMLPACWVVEHD